MAINKPVTGQYEYVHRSGIGLDYFTSRIDRLTLYANGRFLLIIQDSSRATHAAKALINGQPVTANAAETRREGSYSTQGNTLTLTFDDGTQQEGQISWNGDGLQIGSNFFNKLSDSTLLPPAQRMKMDMEDIAKGIKIAGTIGSIAIKAAKTIHDTIQSVQEPQVGAQTSNPPPVSPPAPAISKTRGGESTAQAPYQQNPPSSAPEQVETLFCDQCGARVRAGKRFCNQCGARLP